MTETIVQTGVLQQHLDFAQRMTRVSRLVTLGEMAAGLAHELNQPLGAIATYAMACERMLAASGSGSPDVREALHEISAQALRAGEIIHRLRRMVRPRDPQPEATDINALIRELWGLVLGDARVSGVSLRFDAAPALPTAQVDGLQIQQVLFNLIHNAIEAFAGQPSGIREVIVRTRRSDDGGVEVSVSDSGPGVDPAILERLFHPFSTTKPDGTGLGLAVSRSIVQAHRGRLDYRANRPTGARFLVTLPAVAAIDS